MQNTGAILCVRGGKKQKYGAGSGLAPRALGVLSEHKEPSPVFLRRGERMGSSRRGAYWGLLSEHIVPSPVFPEIEQGAGSDWLLAPWCLFGCFVRTQGTVPCVPTLLFSH